MDRGYNRQVSINGRFNLDGFAMNCPTVEQLRIASLRAGAEVPAAEVARLERLPSWQQRFYAEDLQNARNGWFRWQPTRLFDLAASGPGRRARNHAAAALRQLVDEGLAETFRYEWSDRTYAVSLTPAGRARAEKLECRI